MILDAFLQFSAAAGDVPTTTANSANIIDLHDLGIPVLVNNQGARDMGIGDDPALKLDVQVTAPFAGGTSLQVLFQGAPDNGSGAPGSFTTYASGPVVAVAQLVTGARLFDIDVPRPPPGVPFPRFLQLNYAIVGTMSGGGTIKAYIVIDRMDHPEQANAFMGAYPPGIAIAN